ncbi:UDP-4-amino-4,6-dideoxy-N-acetyl-beta-L-altrosamine transaminase [Planctomycetota bacterium]
MSGSFIPYGRQSIDEDDIAAVVAVLRSDWLTTGPEVEAFEADFAAATGSLEAVAVANGTAALHAAMFALGIGPGDEVIVPAITFVATANSVLYQGGTPVFCDVEPDTLLIDVASAESRITEHTKAIVAVDYAGQPCDYDALRALCSRRGLALVADACHALGGAYKGKPVGSLADLSTFSFHPVKNMTTGEGGMVTTDDPALAARMRTFRNHGITTDFRERARCGTWEYAMTELGYNYRLSDIHCALGRSQLRKLPAWIDRRRAIAAHYDAAFAETNGVSPLAVRPDRRHAYHLYVVRLTGENHPPRTTVFDQLRAAGIGVNVHYLPVHRHPFYGALFENTGRCPIADDTYERILSLPMFQGLEDVDEGCVVRAIGAVVTGGGL